MSLGTGSGDAAPPGSTLDEDASTDGASGGDAPESPEQVNGPRRGRPARLVLEWVAIVAVAVGLALLVRAYVVQTYFIPSGSMEPTLQIGDRILVIKLAYRFTSPSIGDVVVFRAPSNEASMCGSAPVADLVKRIVAGPGDLISSSGNQIIVDGHVLHQTWPHTAELGKAITPTHLFANQYFMLGDNHTESCDSRIWGPINSSQIIGKAVLVFWPLRNFHTL